MKTSKMKPMKTISFLAIVFTFMQCGSVKFDKKPPFSIADASYTNWVGGQPGVSGTKVEINLAESSIETFLSIFFNNKETKVEVRNINGKINLIGHFSTSTKRDLILDVDTKKELKNEVPKETKLPFQLKDNEVVLSYLEAGKTKYYKIINVKKTKQNYY